MYKLKNLEPNRVFHYFEELTRIPRCSFDEEKVSNYLKSVGEDLGLEVIQDDILNIIIRKPASEGYEDAEGVVIQGHMDMVCEKSDDSDHNFMCDALDICIDGDFITANGTTLGADNGIAIAMGLAILEDNSLKHPAIELLVTVNEEATMGGALGLSEDVLQGRRFLNIDSEEEGTLTMGAAGGKALTATLDLDYEEVHEYLFYEIEVKGLAGGHSGMEIHKPLENANKVLNELMYDIKHYVDFRIASISGGTKENAIPRQAKVMIGVKIDDNNKFEENIDGIIEEIISKYSINEKNIEISLEKVDENLKLLSDENTEQILKAVKELHTGAYTQIPGNEDIVESSCNLAILEIKEDILEMIISIRSSNPKVMDELSEKLVNKAEDVGMNTELDEGYPEWEYKTESKLRDIALKTYNDLTGKELKTTVLHAGLECGVVNAKYPDMDIISIGPDMYEVHTPNEKLSISSTKRVFEYVIKLLENLK